jgi:hypothetical protein
MFRTNAFDEFEGQRIENHVYRFVGAEYHPQVDDQTQRLGQELGHGVNKTSGTNAAAVAVQSVTNLTRRMRSRTETSRGGADSLWSASFCLAAKKVQRQFGRHA